MRKKFLEKREFFSNLMLMFNKLQAHEMLRTLKTAFIRDCFHKVYTQTCHIISWNWWKLLIFCNRFQYYLISVSTLTYKACSLFQTIYKMHQAAEICFPLAELEWTVHNYPSDWSSWEIWNCDTSPSNIANLSFTYCV